MAQVNVPLGNRSVGCAGTRIYVLPGDGVDQGDVTNKFLLDGRVKSVSFGANGAIEKAVINFPDRPFGSHIGYGYPIKIIVETSNNIVFRGFITKEISTLNQSDDSMTVEASSFKWFINRLSKIRGRVFTVDDEYQIGDLTDFISESLQQKFLYETNSDSITGYLGAEKTIFNKDGVADCLIQDYWPEQKCIFKLPRLKETGVERGTAHFWTYASILMHIVRFWIKPHVNFVSQISVVLNTSGLEQIIKLGEDIGRTFIEPVDFNINNLSPLAAIDKVVKALPGNWIWRTTYDRDIVKIDIINLDDPPTISHGLIIGTNQKLAVEDNVTNIQSIVINRDIEQSANRAVAVAQPIRVETTVRLTPAWPRYIRSSGERGYEGSDPVPKDPPAPDDGHDSPTLYVGQDIGGSQYLSDFKSPKDYGWWKDSIETRGRTGYGEGADQPTEEDKVRYSQIYRRYILFPDIIKGLFDINSAMQRWNLGGILAEQYSGAVENMKDLFYIKIARVRGIEGPFTNFADLELDNIKLGGSPFVFVYDPARGGDIDGSGNEGDIDAGGVTELKKPKAGTAFDEKIPEQAKYIIPAVEKTSVSFAENNNVVTFNKAQYARKILSEVDPSSSIITEFTTIQARAVFMTCTLVSDVLLVFDKNDSDKREIYNDLNLVTYNFDEGKIALRVDAFYPNPLVVPDGNNKRSVKTSTLDIAIHGLRYTAEPENPTGEGETPSYDFGGAEYLYPILGYNQVFGLINQAPYINGLLQTVYDLSTGTPAFRESMNVDLGRLDLTYEIGQKIKEIVNSFVSGESNSGFYNLDAYIDSMTIQSTGTSNDYTLKMNLKNKDIPTPIDRNVRQK